MEIRREMARLWIWIRNNSVRRDKFFLASGLGSNLTMLTYLEMSFRPKGGIFLKQTASVGFLAALEMTNFNFTLSS